MDLFALFRKKPRAVDTVETVETVEHAFLGTLRWDPASDEWLGSFNELKFSLPGRALPRPPELLRYAVDVLSHPGHIVRCLEVENRSCFRGIRTLPGKSSRCATTASRSISTRTSAASSRRWSPSLPKDIGGASSSKVRHAWGLDSIHRSPRFDGGTARERRYASLSGRCVVVPPVSSKRTQIHAPAEPPAAASMASDVHRIHPASAVLSCR